MTVMKKHFTYIFAASLLVVACDDDYAVKQPTLEVSAPSTVKVGQKVDFSLSGEQDILSFWSGEAGSDYQYKEKDRIGAGDTWLRFTCTTSSGTDGHPNPAGVPLSWSSDFSGEYTLEAMNAATWHDISAEFEWPDNVGVTVPGGELNMGEILPADGTPVYFRFYYHVAPWDQTANEGKGNGRTQWSISAMSFFCNTPAGEYTAYDMFDQRWQLILGDGCETIPSANMPSLPSTSERILFRSQFKPAVDLHMWAVSGAIVRPGDMNLGRDKGMGIKTLADPQMRKFSYTYASPGEYHVTFVGVNAGVDGRKEVVREVKLKVVQDTGSISGPVPADWQ